MFDSLVFLDLFGCGGFAAAGRFWTEAFAGVLTGSLLTNNWRWCFCAWRWSLLLTGLALAFAAEACSWPLEVAAAAAIRVWNMGPGSVVRVGSDSLSEEPLAAG